MLSPLWSFAIFVLAGIAYYAFLAAALLWTWMWVDYVQIHTGKINWRAG
jgi:hypothetical protein